MKTLQKPHRTAPFGPSESRVAFPCIYHYSLSFASLDPYPKIVHQHTQPPASVVVLVPELTVINRNFLIFGKQSRGNIVHLIGDTRHGKDEVARSMPF